MDRGELNDITSPSLLTCTSYYWPPVTSICFQNWTNSWKDGNLLTTMMLSASRVTGLGTKIKNSSTIEFGLWRLLLDQVHFCRRDYVGKLQNIMFIFCC